MTSLKFQKAIVILLFLMVSVSVTYIGLSRGLPLIMAAWALFPVLVYFTNRPDILLCGSIAFFSSQLIVPGMPGGLNIFYILAFLYIVIAFFGRVIQRDLLSDISTCEMLVLLFLLNLLIIIALRGAGFRVFGDENWGGMRYVTLFITLSLFLLGKFARLSEKQWDRTFKWYLGLSLMPFLGELVFVGTGGAIYFHYYFLSFSDLTLGAFINTALGESLVRFSSAGSASQAVIFFAVCYVGFIKQRRVFAWFLLILAFAMASLSGHRIVLIRSLAFLWFFGLSYNHKRVMRYLFLSGVAGLLFIGLLYLTAPHLPHNAQRMISILPGIDISLDAQMNADSTTVWRLNVWREAVHMIPDSLWLGQGFTFPAGITDELMLAPSGDYGYFWALETMAFHNGILSLLVGMGITGLVIGSWVLLGLCVRNFHRQKSQWHSQTLKRIHNVFFINNIVGVLIFFTIYGDVYVSFPGLFFQFMVLEGIWYSETHIRKKNGDTDHTQIQYERSSF